jgi:hypothetical protein
MQIISDTFYSTLGACIMQANREKSPKKGTWTISLLIMAQITPILGKWVKKFQVHLHPIYAWVFQVVCIVQTSPPIPYLRLSLHSATWPAHLILVHLITQKLLGEHRS